MKAFCKIILLIISFACVCFSLTACIPPFIDGQVNAEGYFIDAVYCNIYALDFEAEGGYSVNVGADMTLSALTDDNEKNIPMEYYFSFTFTAQEDISIKTIAFMAEAEEETELSFKLEHNTSIYNQNVNLNTREKTVVQFADLTIDIASSEEITISLANPLASNVRYRIDTIIFVI